MGICMVLQWRFGPFDLQERRSRGALAVSSGGPSESDEERNYRDLLFQGRMSLMSRRSRRTQALALLKRTSALHV
jgi:hypothetical protein